MIQSEKTKLLIKILVGTAWLDGTIQPEERNYLQQVVSKNNLQQDKEIESLLSEIKPVSPDSCYQWLEEYLGHHPTPEDYQQLLESISALVYSDGDIDIQEAKLLSRLQDFQPTDESLSLPAKILQSIRELYQRAIAS